MSTYLQIILKKISHYYHLLKNLLMQHYPVAIFFIALFFLMIYLFGVQFVIFVPIYTVMFKKNYRKDTSLYLLLKFAGSQFIISVLGYMTAFHISLLVFLNLTVIFYLVYMNSSQFNPLGYYLSLMNFIFSQLNLDNHEFLLKVASSFFGLSFFILGMLLFNWFSPKKTQQIEDQVYQILAKLIHTIVIRKNIQQDLEQLKTCMYQLYQQAYLFNEDYLKTSLDGRIAYNYGLLCQRFIHHLEYPEEYQKLITIRKETLLELRNYLLAVDQAIKSSSSQQKELLIHYGRSLEIKWQKTDNTLPLSAIINHILYILNLTNSTSDPMWKLPRKHHSLFSNPFYNHDGIDNFEFRAALKISILLTLCFITIHFFHISKAAWLPMNVFLLVRPLDEETNYRIKTRLLGTLIGCTIGLAFLPILHSFNQHILIASILGIFVYILIPGSAIQATLSTMFGLMLSTLALPVTSATELRGGFVLIAILLVYTLSKFLFPLNKQYLFKHNLFKLIHLHLSYLDRIQEKLDLNLDYTEFAKIQITNHLIQSEIQNYAETQEIHDFRFTEIMETSWSMIVTIEQIFSNIDPFTDPADKSIIDHWLVQCKRNLSTIQSEVREPTKRNEFIPFYQSLELINLTNPYLEALMLRYFDYTLYIQSLIYPPAPSQVMTFSSEEKQTDEQGN